MLNNLSTYQIDALRQLASYRRRFYDTSLTAYLKKTKKDPIQEFIGIFCGNNFADTDYYIIQQELAEFDSMETWLSQASLEAVLKCLTYFIWTDKIMDGYFKTRIENRSIEKLLTRLEVLLQENHLALFMAS